MTKMSRKEQMKADLARRNQEAEKSNDSFGGSFNNSVMVDDLPMWRCPEDEHIIDIIPYQVGANHPNPKIKEGEWGYYFEFFVHYGVGPMDGQFVCLKETYNLPCPICEARMALRNTEDFDEAEEKKLKAKKRTLYNVVVYTSDDEEKKGVQVWHVAHWYMQKNIVPLAKNKRTGQSIPFSDAYDGKSIQFTRKGIGQHGEFLGHTFLDREEEDGAIYEISDDILDAAFTLEECINKPEYEEVRAAFYGEASGDEGTDEPEVEKEEASAPSRKGRRTTKASDKTEAPKKGREAEVSSTNGCPAGGKFGIDLSALSECDSCDVWDDCRSAKSNAED